MLRLIRNTIIGTVTAVATIVGIVSAILSIYSASTGQSISVTTIVELVSEPRIEVSINPELERQLLEAARKYNGLD